MEEIRNTATKGGIEIEKIHFSLYLTGIEFEFDKMNETYTT